MALLPSLRRTVRLGIGIMGMVHFSTTSLGTDYTRNDALRGLRIWTVNRNPRLHTETLLLSYTKPGERINSINISRDDGLSRGLDPRQEHIDTPLGVTGSAKLDNRHLRIIAFNR